MLGSKGLRKILTSGTAQVSFTCAALALGSAALKADDQVAPGKSAEPAAALKSHVRELIEEVSDAAVDLDLVLNRPKLIRSKMDVVRVTNSDPRVTKVDKVANRDIEILGKKSGSSVVTLWLGNDSRARMLQINVHVKADGTGAKAVAPAVVAKAERPVIKRVSARTDADGPPQFHPDQETSDSPEATSQEAPEAHQESPQAAARVTPPAGATGATTLAVLERELTESFPGSHVRVFPVGHRLIVRGNANNPQEAVKILEFVRQQSSEGDESRSSRGETVSADHVVNLIKVPGDSQIRLKVQSVEMQRTALRQFCQQFDLRFDQQPDAAWNPSGAAPATLSLNTTAFQNYLRALQTRRAAQIEDEPNHVVVSGQPVALPVRHTTAAPAPAPANKLPGVTRTEEPERLVPVLIPSVGENGRFRLEFSAKPLRSRHAESGEENEGEFGRSRPTILRAGESLLVTGLSPRVVSPENVLLLVITPELSFEKEGGSEPPLVPPERGRKSSPYALKQTTIHATSIEAEQRSGNFYLSGPSGYSD